MIELERKWLVDKDKLVVPETAVKWIVVQGYLNTMHDDWIIRVRSVDLVSFVTKLVIKRSYFLELKSKGLLAREELRYEIIEAEFDETLNKCGGIVRKTRFLWNDTEKGVQYEVDFYDDHDFVTCEVEFKSMKESNDFVAPDWCVEDVTFDPKYKNVNLGK